jgi:HEAT repeat protein
VTLSSAPVPTEDPGRPEPPFPSTLVEEMLRLLVKAIRAYQLYLHNNPTYLRAVEAVRNSFTPIWAETDEVVLTVTETELRWEGVPVSHEPDKASDSLAWILYKDGIREIRLLKDFEHNELIPLLDVLQKARLATPDDDDLLTMMWEQEFAFLRYRYIDMASDQGAPLEKVGYAGGQVLADEAKAGEQQAPQIDQTLAGVVNLEDFDSTLYFLDEGEIGYLREEVQKEYSADLRGNVISILLDVFEQQTNRAVRDEICTTLETLLLHLLSAAEFRTAAYLLRETAMSAQRAQRLEPEQRDRLLAIPSRLSEPEVLTQILQSLDETSELPDQQDLNELFDQFRVGALGTVLGWIGKLQTPKLRVMLENTAARLAMSNTAELVRLISSSDREVALEAVRRAGAVKATAAVSSLAKLIGDADVSMRLAAVQALGEIASPGALQLIERTIDDASRDVRVATARIIASRAHRAALPKLEAVVRGKVARDADLTEKMALFEAYGTLCGDAGVTLLDGLLNSRGLFGKREDPELRACAAMALGRVASEPAIAALRRASAEKEVLVRNAVNRALRGGAA